MKKITFNQVRKLRAERNKDLIDRMNAGESLSNYSNANSWFPARPIVEKDQDAMAKLYDLAGRKTKLAQPAKMAKSKEGKKAKQLRIV